MGYELSSNHLIFKATFSERISPENETIKCHIHILISQKSLHFDGITSKPNQLKVRDYLYSIDSSIVWLNMMDYLNIIFLFSLYFMELISFYWGKKIRIVVVIFINCTTSFCFYSWVDTSWQQGHLYPRLGLF